MSKTPCVTVKMGFRVSYIKVYCWAKDVAQLVACFPRCGVLYVIPSTENNSDTTNNDFIVKKCQLLNSDC